MRPSSPDSCGASLTMTLNESASFLLEKMMSSTPETKRYEPYTWSLKTGCFHINSFHFRHFYTLQSIFRIYLCLLKHQQGIINEFRYCFTDLLMRNYLYAFFISTIRFARSFLGCIFAFHIFSGFIFLHLKRNY